MSERRDPAWEDELAVTASFRAQLRDAMADVTPPPYLDVTILAAAHRAVGSKPVAAGKGGLRRWRVPLSAAAVLVLASSIAVLFHEEGTHRRVLLTESPPAMAPVAGDVPVPTVMSGAPGSTGAPGREAADNPSKPDTASASAPTVAEPEQTPAGRSRSTRQASREPGQASRDEAPRLEAFPERKAAARPSPGPRPAAATAATASPAAGAVAHAPDTSPGESERAPAVPKAAPAPSPVAVPADSGAESADRTPPVPPPTRDAGVTSAAPEAREAMRAAVPSAGAPSESAASSALGAAERHALTHAQAKAKRRAEADTVVPSLEEAEALWRAGRRDEARALVRRWRCAHPGEMPPPRFPIPFDEDTRCLGAPAKDAAPPDR